MASIKRRPDGVWRARYVPPGGKEVARHFATRGDAQRWLNDVTAGLVRGDYVDPRGGRRLFGEVARSWQAAQVHDKSTAESVDSTLRNHILPTFEDRPIAAVRPSEVQAWVKGRSAVLAPSTLEVAYRWLAAIFASAVQDGLIARTPCRGVKRPAIEKTRVVPLPTKSVLGVIAAMPERYRGIVVVAAGTGLRQGEVFGLASEDVDFLRRTVHVRQQVKLLSGRPPFLAPPKTESSRRSVPLPNVVLEALAEHVRRWPSDGQIFLDDKGELLRRHRFYWWWQKALTAAGLPKGTGFHELRHHYASVLIGRGASVKVVQARLGHKSALETLDTYGHLWPEDEDLTRRAIDEAFGAPADFSRTEEEAL